MGPFSPKWAVWKEFYARAKVKSIGAECPSRVNMRHSQLCPECRMLGEERKSISGDWPSESSQEATFEPDRNRCSGKLCTLVEQRLRLLQIGGVKPRGEAPAPVLPLAVAYNSDAWAAA